MRDDGGTLGARAVFLDKDGTLIPNVPYNADPARITLSAGAGEALRRLQDGGYRLFVVSNQSGVARGFFPASALDGVEARLRALLAAEGAALDGVAWCPHHPRGAIPAYAVECDCRKPLPGMLVRLAAAHGVDLGASWMVGDSAADVGAGRAAGCRTVLVGGAASADAAPDAAVADLAAAADAILAA